MLCSADYTTESIVGSFLCPNYWWTPSLWNRLFLFTKPPFVSWCGTPDPLFLDFITWNGLPLLAVVKTWSSLVSSFPRGCYQSLWEWVDSAVPSSPSRDGAWHTRSMMAQFICVSDLTDVLTEASNWMVPANKSNGKKKEKGIRRIIFFLFLRIKFMPFSCLIPCR